MNEKKAKRLRQLTKHLMQQGALAADGWRVMHPQTQYVDDQVPTRMRVKNEQGVRQYQYVMVQRRVATGTVQLDPACGLAIYRQMKKRAELQHRPV